MRELTVVVSTLGNYAGLRRVLDRFESQDAAAGSFEVLVVSDAAEPDSEAVDRAIQHRPYPLRRLTGRRPGASANRNAGWRAADTPLVMFTDNDTLAQPNLLSEHMHWHRRYAEEEVAVLGHVRWAREVRVTPFMRWLDYGFQFDYPSIQGIEAGWGRFYSANISVKRPLMEKVGGFDEQRLPYLYEDLDLGYRASKIGLRVLYNRNAVVEHLKEVDLDLWRSRVRQLAIAERQFVRLHPEIAPYFRDRFSRAAGRPRVRGRGRHLIRHVPRGFPWLGPRVWASAGQAYLQELAPHFLEAWEEAERMELDQGGPELSRFEGESSLGRRSSGPK